MTLFQGISGKFEDQLEDENVEELSHGVRVFIENEMLPSVFFIKDANYSL